VILQSVREDWPAERLTSAEKDMMHPLIEVVLNRGKN
jgi:hypothetical protein